MTYENDPLLPILQEEIANRTKAYAGLSSAEESALLSLSNEQKKSLLDADKSAKAEFLKTLPKINHPGIKTHEKFKSFASSIQSQQFWSWTEKGILSQGVIQKHSRNSQDSI